MHLAVYSQEPAKASLSTANNNGANLALLPDKNARELVLRAKQSMAGETKLRGLAGVTLEGIGHE